MVEVEEVPTVYDRYISALNARLTDYESRIQTIEHNNNNTINIPSPKTINTTAAITAAKLTLPTSVLVYYMASNRDVGLAAKLLSFLVLVYMITTVTTERYLPATAVRQMIYANN